MRAIEAVLTDGPRTRDIGGTARTEEVGKAIAAAVGDARGRWSVPSVVVLTRVAPVVLDRLREHARVTDVSALPRDAWGPRWPARSACCRARTCRSTPRSLAAAPALRIVAMQSVGYDNVDVAALRARGIVLTNSRGSLVEAVADLTYALVDHGGAPARPGDWPGRARAAGCRAMRRYGHDLAGATLGVVGFGAIGTAVARRAQASGMRVVYHTRTPRDDDAATGGAYRSFEQLLQEADCVVALLPLTRRRAECSTTPPSRR